MIDNARVCGTRITVYDVHYYLERGRSCEEIADILSISLSQVAAAVRFIESHLGHVKAVHERIEERNKRGNPPHTESQREASRSKMKAWLSERQVAIR